MSNCCLGINSLSFHTFFYQWCMHYQRELEKIKHPELPFNKISTLTSFETLNPIGE